MVDMAVEFDYDTEGWRPSWGQMLDIIQRVCHGQESAEELRWLRSHPVDWLMCTRYQRERTENHIALARKRLKEIESLDPQTGGVRAEYRAAKREVDLRNARQLHWREKIIEQSEEAKFILGWERLPHDQLAAVVDRLLQVRMKLLSDLWDDDDVVGTVGSLIRDLTGDTFDPDFYRPRES